MLSSRFGSSGSFKGKVDGFPRPEIAACADKFPQTTRFNVAAMRPLVRSDDGSRRASAARSLDHDYSCGPFFRMSVFLALDVFDLRGSNGRTLSSAVSYGVD